MTQMMVPSSFRSLNYKALQNTSKVSASKTNTLAGNTAWLFEGYLNLPIADNNILSNSTSFNHTGNGQGKHLPVIMNIDRGLYRSGTSFNDPISITGDGSETALKSIVNDFYVAWCNPSEGGFNYRSSLSINFIPHLYAKKIRCQIEIKRTSGTKPGEIFPVIYADSKGESIIAKGNTVFIEQNDFTIVELVVDLDDAPYERGTMPSSFWYWGLRTFVPYGTSVQIQDGQTTGPCLAISSV